MSVGSVNSREINLVHSKTEDFFDTLPMHREVISKHFKVDILFIRSEATLMALFIIPVIGLMLGSIPVLSYTARFIGGPSAATLGVVLGVGVSITTLLIVVNIRDARKQQIKEIKEKLEKNIDELRDTIYMQIAPYLEKNQIFALSQERKGVITVAIFSKEGVDTYSFNKEVMSQGEAVRDALDRREYADKELVSQEKLFQTIELNNNLKVRSDSRQGEK